MANDIKQLNEVYTNSILNETEEFSRGTLVSYKSQDGTKEGRGTVLYTIRSREGPVKDHQDWRVVSLDDGTEVRALTTELTLAATDPQKHKAVDVKDPDKFYVSAFGSKNPYNTMAETLLAVKNALKAGSNIVTIESPTAGQDFDPIHPANG